MSEPNSEPVDLEGLFDIMTQSKSKSQMRRLAIQTGICETIDIVAMGRLVAGNLHANGDIGWAIDSETVDLLCSEVERLQQQSDGYKEHVLLLKEHVASLQAELGLPKEPIGSQVFGEVGKLTAAKAILGDPNPPYPVVPKSTRSRLIRNAAHCHTCDTIIESKSRHSWVACKCADNSNTGIYVDGGLAYSRRGAGVNAIYTDLCEYTK